MNNSKEHKEMFAHLVSNAFDFLTQSISEIEKKPKYSVIHFHAAIELFLKARLVAEHWSLVVSPKKEADWKDFISGKFASVTLEESGKRLEKVVQSGLSEKQLKSFRAVTKHRNKMIHFYHDAETAEAGEQRIRSIVKEQLTAWYFLHDLLTRQWENIFGKWKDQIAVLDTNVRKNHEFLKVVFDMLKSQILAEKEEGYEFRECPSCGFESDKHICEENILYESTCHVCGLTENCIKIHCTECDDGIALYQGEPYAICENCSEEYGGDELLDIFVDEGEAHLAVKDGGDYPFPLNCGECSGYETVVEVDEQKYLCTQCFTITNEYGMCEWCHDASTGLPEGTYYNGCEICDGKAGWDDD